ncbi:Helix-turn-helix protein [Streptomyces lincolnensis]|uniref:Helix-turn-helix protein n=1 Tax=Streptomyces lincolnensis TaxID=1915 RepID=A0A1B1M3U2_STRLN|nr:helix-turn-helix transcriptional regulator [Streptomyces lincolnensis]ANS63331.1 Helix-turn-helix protein [Streptomyces lincolnensis]AXG52253.1 Helix-turn-helix protein [Streptomyces lincolnensis]QMV05228.1 helix-turn-helix domain-containing protein [Streptomyces lincolnensis]
MDRNAELGDFLRTRRARLSPGDAGVVPGGGVRRVPGLRREEVASLAGVSADYYTRLEQGRHPHVSEAVLDAVARALRLDDDERDHLFNLARPRTPRSRRHRRPERVQRARPEVHRMLDVLNGVTAAFVTNHRQDVLAANPLARALITDWDELPYRDRNFARYVLLDPTARELYTNWDEVAERVVADLRLVAGRHPDDARLNELIGEAIVKVPEFGAWWDSHRVALCAYGTQRFHHPLVGEFALHHETLTLPSDPDQALCVYTAEPGSPSAQTLALLASWSAPPTLRGHLPNERGGC